MSAIDPQQLFLMLGLHEMLSGIIKSIMGSIRDEGGAFPIHLLFYGALGYAVYWTYNRGWWHQAWEWWEWRGMASVQLSAEVEFDLTVEKEKVPDRFLAVLHRIHQYLIDQRIHAQCMSFQVLTPLRGATDTDETAMSYLMPVGSRKLRLTDGKASIWIKTSISTRDPPEGNNGGGNNNSMGFGMGNARLLAPKQSVLVEVYSKGSSAALDATLKRWEVEYNKHIEELLHSKLTVLRPEVRTYWDDSPYLVYHEHPLGEVMLSDIVLSKETRRQLDGLVRAIQDPDRFRCIGADYQVNILLHGPPGTGKTTIAKALARNLTRYLMHVRLQSMRTVQLMEEVFTRPGGKSSNITAKDLVYLLDEFDHALKELVEDKRGGFFSTKGLSALTNTGTGPSVKIGADDPPSVHSIKALLDGALNVPGRVVIATSNSIEKLMEMGEDSSFLRARRMECIYVGLCDAEMLRQFWRRIFGEGHELEEEVASLPEDVLAPAEVSSVLLSNYGRPDTALLDLKRMVAAKEATPAEDKKEGEKEENKKEDENKSEEEKKEEDDDGEEEEDGEGSSEDDKRLNVNVHLHLNGVKLREIGPQNGGAFGAFGDGDEVGVEGVSMVRMRHVTTQASISDKWSTVAEDDADSRGESAVEGDGGQAAGEGTAGAGAQAEGIAAGVEAAA